MRYADFYDCDICNGNSIGVSLFVQGCPLHCEGCFNPETWDFNNGKEWNSNSEEKFLSLINREYIKRISILGGSPLCDENANDVLALVKKIKELHPDKKIWIYTGYTWEYLINKPIQKQIIELIDVLVDGRFECSKKDITLPWVGSSNQRVIDVQKTLENKEIVLWS